MTSEKENPHWSPFCFFQLKSDSNYKGKIDADNEIVDKLKHSFIETIPSPPPKSEALSRLLPSNLMLLPLINGLNVLGALIVSPIC